MVDEEKITKLLIPTGISLFGAFARFAFAEKKSFFSFVRGVVIAGFVGLMTSLGIHDIEMSEGLRGLIIGVTSFCADEVAMFLVSAAGELKKDPLGYASKVISALRGK